MPGLLNKKTILYIILGAVTLYGIIWLLTREPQMPADYKATIDSLAKANAALAEQQKTLDKDIHSYEGKVEQVDSQIHNIKEKTTVIKEYHHEIIQQVGNYNATELEIFFRNRYNY
mgnify:FL=1